MQAAIQPPLNPVVHWAQQHRQAKERVIQRRIRDFEILLLEHGEVLVEIQGREPFLVQSGQFFLLPAELKHRVQVLSQPDALFIGVHFDFYNELLIAKDEDIIVYGDPDEPVHYCSMPQSPEFQEWLSPGSLHATPEMYSLLSTIIHEFTQRPAGYMMCCQGLLLQLFAQMSRAIHQHHRAGASAGMQLAITRLATAIEQDVAEHWCNEKMADLLNINVDYMGRLFKKCTGRSPNKFVQQIRHAEAKRLLRETSDTIEAIGYAVGYKDVHYFVRIFHKWEGMPPGEYRKFCRLL
ncbi:helix-turn-helix domain-containing protein [Paenibacillus sp. JSM ZJ436]|uniref:helix-turn-helix transcriptional regulator n=1 Tax=Paenibacillus sp. JSM ZJ436 TaxID=3376190 RepID=UPI00379C79EC